MEHERYFTVEEANDALESLRPLVQEVLEIRHDLDALGYDLPSRSFVREPDDEDVERVEKKLARLEQVLDEVHETGALYKDPTFEKGTLDFPHLREGKDGEKEVYLCWMEGEDEVGYWHPVDEGMRGRRPL